MRKTAADRVSLPVEPTPLRKCDDLYNGDIAGQTHDRADVPEGASLCPLRNIHGDAEITRADLVHDVIDLLAITEDQRIVVVGMPEKIELIGHEVKNNIFEIALFHVLHLQVFAKIR